MKESRTPKQAVADAQFLTVAKLFYWIAVIFMLIFSTVPTIALICNLDHESAAGWAMGFAILYILGFGGIPYLVSLIGSIVCMRMSSRYSKATAARVNLLSGMVVIEAMVAALLVFLIFSGIMKGGWALYTMVLLVALAVMAIIAPQVAIKRLKNGKKS